MVPVGSSPRNLCGRDPEEFALARAAHHPAQGYFVPYRTQGASAKRRPWRAFLNKTIPSLKRSGPGAGAANGW